MYLIVEFHMRILHVKEWNRTNILVLVILMDICSGSSSSRKISNFKEFCHQIISHRTIKLNCTFWKVFAFGLTKAIKFKKIKQWKEHKNKQFITKANSQCIKSTANKHHGITITINILQLRLHFVHLESFRFWQSTYSWS